MSDEEKFAQESAFIDKAKEIVRWMMDGDPKSKLECASVIKAALAAERKAGREEIIREYVGKHPLIQCFCAGKQSYVAELCRGCHCRIGYEWDDDNIHELKQKARQAALEEAARIAEEWRCQAGGDKCYPCDCGGEVPQDEISQAIRAKAGE